MNIKKKIKKKIFKTLSGTTHEIDSLRYKDLIYKKKNYIYEENPVLTVGEICKLIKINVPLKYKKDEDKLLIDSKLVDLLHNKNEIISNTKKGKITTKQHINLCIYMRKFKKKYYSLEPYKHNDTELLELLVQGYYFYSLQGFNYNDFFDYELIEKDDKDLCKFLNSDYRNVIYRICNNNKKIELFFKNKVQFNKKFKKYIYRDWIDGSDCTFEEFSKFVNKHNDFFVKPICGTGGAGARKLKYGNDNMRKLYKFCKNKKMICEEIIKQDKEFSKFNKDTLNTLRLYTLYPANGEPFVTMANARFGRVGNAVDNFHSGGMSCGIDLKTGTLCTDAINRAHVFYKKHPDSNVKFDGFKIPHWDEFVSTVCKAAKEVPQIRHIGWDVALNSNGKIEFVEGNCWPNFDITQAVDQKGKKPRYEKYILELEKLKDNK